MENGTPFVDSQPTQARGVHAADTALSILEAVAFSRAPLGVTQIAAALGTAKGATFRYLQTLLDRGYLVQDPVSSRFRLGQKVFLLGRNAPGEWDLAAMLAAPMRQLRDETGLSVVLSTQTSQGACVLETAPGTTVIEIGVRVGSTLAMHASAQGKVFLAFGPADHLDRVIRTQLVSFTEHTITTVEALRAEVGSVRRQGYATAPEEVLPGINTLAVPVFEAAGTAIAALAVVGSIYHVPASPDPHLVGLMIDLGRTASRLLSNANINAGYTQGC